MCNVKAMDHAPEKLAESMLSGFGEIFGDSILNDPGSHVVAGHAGKDGDGC